MPELVALPVPSARFIQDLRRAWDDGDAVFPLDLRLAAPAREAVLQAMAPRWLQDEHGERQRLEDALPVEEGDALVVATSGTTGTPRGVVLTHDAVRASAIATSDRVGVDRRTDRWLACLPLSHVGGLSVVTRAMVTGTLSSSFPSSSPRRSSGQPDGGSTLVSLVPTALRRIDPSLFRVIVLGGAAPPEALPPNVVTTYGMTETGSGVVYDGVPLDGVEVAVDDEDGSIMLRGPMLLRCYRDGSDPKHSGGWLTTGDVGALDADGRLVVHGRRDDLIITGGENVWPDPVERVLRTVTRRRRRRGRRTGRSRVGAAGRRVRRARPGRATEPRTPPRRGEGRPRRARRAARAGARGRDPSHRARQSAPGRTRRLGAPKRAPEAL